jgi:AraC family transcriptional regulator
MNRSKPMRKLSCTKDALEESMTDGTLARWERAINRATALIAARLDDPPALEELAAAAAISRFHFHRIWRVMTGETIGETMRRLRLEQAAHTLSNSERSVTDVALSSGFATPQAFARAFRREKGISPSVFRGQKESHARHAASPKDAPVEIVWVAPTTIIAKRRNGGPYQNLNAEFGAVWTWAQTTGLLEHLRAIYGIPYDDPASVPEAMLHYDACLDFGSEPSLPDHLHFASLGGCEHARVRVVGSYNGLDAAMQCLLGDWLIQSGREPADAPMFHHFLNDPDATPESELITDIYLPLSEGTGVRE